ncbi:ABC transporter permease subunit [Streptomyces sp. NBC_01381]|uniref:ABC transporter permease subunit n=1 Tax=Streptomyces sp. NBC_01381 TaxID=2903845 RepID=UPI0022540D06|nr:ABC transporter permease subunit [Streptomyces sp. NBC_01381]MCX4668926.1 ABC transporter permease subunit [Streptomyces sp. NBC_01381]
MTTASPPRRPGTALVGRAGFPQLLRAEWTKLRTVRRWGLTLLAAVVVTVLISLFSATSSGIETTGGGGGGGSPAPTGPGGVSIRDDFTFVHRPLTGDGSVTARVTGPTGEQPRRAPEWAKAGVLIKESTDPGSEYAALMVTAGHGVRLQSEFIRDVAGGAASAATPHWLRLVRSGATVTAYESADGRTWHEVGTVRLGTSAEAVQVGLFVASPNAQSMERKFGNVSASDQPSRSSARFDEVTAKGATGGDWRLTDVGQPSGDGQPTGGGQPSGDGHSSGGGQPTDAGQPIGAAQPSGAGQPTRAEQPTRDGQPTDAGQPTGDEQPSDAEQPTGPGQPSGGGQGELRRAGGEFTVTGSGDIAPGTPMQPDLVAASLNGSQLSLVLVAALGVLFITAEYRRGMIRTTFAVSPRRGRVLLAKAVVIGAVTFVTGLVACLLSYLLSMPALRAGGHKPPLFPEFSLTDGPVLRAVIGTAALLALIAVLALGLGALLRNTAAAITTVVVVIVLPLVLVSMVPLGLSQWLQRLTPVAGFAIQQTTPRYDQVAALCLPEDGCYPQGAWTGFGTLAAYAVVVLGLAVWRVRRRDA